MVTFVTNTKDLPHSNKIIKRLTEKFPEIVSIVHNVNLEKTNVIIGKKMLLLYGEKYLYDKIDDLTFGISSGRSEEHTSELQSRGHLVCRLLLEKKKIKYTES